MPFLNADLPRQEGRFPQDGARPEPIAIVGMGCRWPGDVRDAPGLWELLKNKRSGYRQFGDDHRFDLSGFHHPNADRPGTIATKGGFLLGEDPRLFDHSFFAMQPLEVETMDPSQRKLLEVVYEAFENAGETWETFSGSRTGVYVGNFTNDHVLIQGRDTDHPRPYASTGTSISILSNRVNYIFNLQGPSVTMDTACSSSMYALHMAVAALRNGDCDAAIVAASNTILDPGTQQMMTKLGVLSATSACHTFDASADGYARGEGFAALYLRKMSDVVGTPSPIRAFIRGTAINSNGRTGGITHPSRQGQEAVIRKAYENAGNLALEDTTYFECHGTGTPVGDPIEISAIGNVFSSARRAAGDSPLLVGSIKTNLGHTESASALAGIMKVVLAMEADMIPPSIGIQQLNPNIDFSGANVDVLTDVTPWPAGRLRRAGINSFGYGGANGHCIIDHVNNVLPGYRKPGIAGREPLGRRRKRASFSTAMSSPPSPVQAVDAATRQLVLLPFAAHNQASLDLNVQALAHVMDRHSLADIAYTLSAHRSRFARRTFCIVDRDAARLEGGKSALLASNTQAPSTSGSHVPKLGFIFTGQGAQWHAMGASLFQYHVFAATIDHLDDVLASLPDPLAPSWTLASVLAGECKGESANRPELSQTTCTALQIGLVNLLRAWSVEPVAVAGHSSGEIAASYAAGRITAAEAIVSAYLRGQAVARNQRDGRMLAVGLGPGDQLQGYLRGLHDRVKVAAVNSPRSVTLSGDRESIEALAAVLSEANVFNRLLQTGGNAYHSHHMLALGEYYESILTRGLEHLEAHGLTAERDSSAKSRQPVSWVSSVSPNEDLAGVKPGAAYWRANLESPVRFVEAVEKLMQISHGDEAVSVDALVEIGPHPALKSPLRQILESVGKPSAPYVASLKRGEDGHSCLLQLAGSLFGLNASVDLVAVNATDGLGDEQLCGCTAIDLPPYKFAYGPIAYHEGRASKEFRARDIIRHDLLGSKIPGNAKLRPQWRNVLRPKDLPWLGEHRLLPHAVFPAAGYIAIAVEAALRSYNHQESRGEERPVATGVSMRNVSISTALRVPEDDLGVEIVTSMELVEPAKGSPGWATFSISSTHDGAWTEHCSGRVRVELGASLSGPRMPIPSAVDSRAVDVGDWYKRFAQVGLGYGPAFQGLREMRADDHAGDNLAVAKVGLKTTAGTVVQESPYALHPASLDAIFQLGLIACHGGRADRASQAFVPVHFESLYLKNTAAAAAAAATPDTATAVARGHLRGLRGAYAQMQMVDEASGEVVLDIPKLRCVSYTDSSSSSSSAAANSQAGSKLFSAPFFRLAWKPDMRAMNNAQARRAYPSPPENQAKVHLFEVFDRLGSLIVAEIFDKYATNNPAMDGAAEDIQHFMAWVRRRMTQDDTRWINEAKTLSGPQRLQQIEQLFRETADAAEVKITRQLFTHLDDVLYARKTGLDVVVQDNLLSDLYEHGITLTGAYPQLERVVDGLSYANPNLEILEVGAGTGGATRVIMKALTAPSSGIKRYKKYTFTDVSSGFLTAARQTFSQYRDVEYSVLDIEQNPLDHGFEPRYDVVVASECLHATASIANTLQNCRRLLKPGGKLVLVENTRNIIGHGVVLGTLTGYWSGIPDGRVDSPFLSVEGWHASLCKTGFSGTDVVLDDYPAPYATACTIVSTAVAATDAVHQREAQPLGSVLANGHAEGPAENVILIHDGQDKPTLCDGLTAELKRRGTSSATMPMATCHDRVPPKSRLIVLLGDGDSLLHPDEARLSLVKKLARESASMVWITASGLIRGKKPDAGVAAGLLRTLGTENPTSRFLFLDVDPDSDARDANLARTVVDQEQALQRRSTGEAEDREFAWQDGCLWVSRLVPDHGLQQQREAAQMAPSRARLLPFHGQGQPVRAAFETPGLLTSLYFRPDEAMQRRPLGRDEIQIRVAAVGLNWKDLAVSAGRFDLDNLSSECSGVVHAVGSAVDSVAVGDRVYGMARGHFGNYVRTPARFVQRLAPGDDLVRMASMPLVYMTAVYAFEHATRVARGETVLVQSATGGLGLCAIQLARAMGADVFATVGNADKARMLVDEMHMPASHVFSSRDAADVRRMVDATGGRGFDVILSTATGDMLHESVRALAPLGRYIDVGRVDVQNSMTMGLELFQRSATFASFDLGLVVDARPELGCALMEAVDAHYRAGRIAPIANITASDVAQLDQVLLGFSKGTHIGKLVVTFTDPTSLVKMVPPVPRARFDPEAQYVLTGGFGGLARAILNWMAERGARHMLVLSRSGASSPESRALVKRLAASGVEVRAALCDVASAEAVAQIVADAHAVRAIKGLVHAAVSYEDLSFDKLPLDKWQSGLAAKVAGTKNLHEATKALPLDFFVMTTSLETVLALATQSAYTAANNFQELFARHRRSMGLPASTASFGLITDVGHLSTNATTLSLMARNKALGVTETQFLRLLEPAFLNSHAGDAGDAGDDNNNNNNAAVPWIGAEDDPLSACNIVTCLDPAELAAKKRAEDEASTTGGAAAGPTPRWYSDARVSLVMRAFADADAHQHSDNENEHNDRDEHDQRDSALRREFGDAIARGAAAEAEALVLAAIVATVAGMLFVDAAGVDGARTVADYGVDSLIAAELRNWFNTTFGADISILDLLDTRNTMRALAGAVVQGALTPGKRVG